MTDGAIRPFTIEFAQDAVDDMRRRVAATRWPERETVDDDSQGVPLAMMQELAGYWATDYDWSACEASPADLAHGITEVELRRRDLRAERGVVRQPRPR